MFYSTYESSWFGSPWFQVSIHVQVSKVGVAPDFDETGTPPVSTLAYPDAAVQLVGRCFALLFSLLAYRSTML